MTFEFLETGPGGRAWSIVQEQREAGSDRVGDLEHGDLMSPEAGIAAKLIGIAGFAELVRELVQAIFHPKVNVALPLRLVLVYERPRHVPVDELEECERLTEFCFSRWKLSALDGLPLHGR